MGRGRWQKRGGNIREVVSAGNNLDMGECDTNLERLKHNESFGWKYTKVYSLVVQYPMMWGMIATPVNMMFAMTDVLLRSNDIES